MNDNVFESPEAFQEYASQLAARLKSRWEERIRFLRQGIAQLQALQRVAEAVRDEDTLAELQARLSTAQEELQRLETAAAGGAAPRPPAAAGAAAPPPKSADPPTEIIGAPVMPPSPANPAAPTAAMSSPILPPAARTQPMPGPPAPSSAPTIAARTAPTIAEPAAAPLVRETPKPPPPRADAAPAGTAASNGKSAPVAPGPTPSDSMARTRRMHLDLNTGLQRIEWVENRTLGEKLGGIGRSFPFLRDHYTRVADAYDPQNPLIINVGCVTGSKAMTGLRVYFTAYSPLKQSRNDDPGVAYSAASGDFGSFFRRTGLDDLVLMGRAATPSLLVLDGDGETMSARIEDAASLRGLTTNQRVQILKEQFPNAHFAVVGPAGENLVRYAAIACSTERQTKGGKLMRFAGRAGMGAVLASKNVLGIVARGTMKIPNPVSNPAMVPFNKEVSRGEGSYRYRELGTWPFNIEALTGPKGGLPIRNFSVANDPRARALYVGKVRERYGVEDHNCTACGIKCWKVLTDGPEVLAKLDHEPLTLLGPNLDIWDIGQIAHLVELGDEYGMDSISLGGVLGFAMEHNLEGLEFGDADGAAEAIRRIGTGLSPLLSQGVRRIARQMGLEASAVHSHGLELAAYLGNTDPGAAFALVGNHMTMSTFNSAINKLITTVDEWETEIVDLGVRRLIYDMVGLCKFANTPVDMWTPLLAEYGITCSVDDLYDTSLDIYRMGRNLDYQQGFTSDDDVLPDRCFHPLPGQGTPQFMTREFFEQLKPRVYAGLRI